MEGGVRVPLIISGPGIDKGRESDIPVSGSDLLPTIVSLAGDDSFPLDEIDGGSFSDVLYSLNQFEIKRNV